jgi:hypothetical protein
MQTGRLVMILGAAVFVIGVLIYLAGRFGLNLGHLPGDIRIVRENFTCIFPLATMILLSIILTVGLNLLIRFLNK